MKCFKQLILVIPLSLAMLSNANADNTNDVAQGTLISKLVGANVTDVDTDADAGLALTAVDASNGTWYYTTDGTTWNVVGKVAENNALLLAADAKTQLYFQPKANFNGSVINAITFRAWDQTSGSAGSKVDTSTNGDTTAFSRDTDTANIIITAVNDAPTAADKTVTIAEDTSVSSELSASDIEADSLTYSLVNDANKGSAIISNAGDFTYTPNADFNGTDSFTYKVNDGTVDSNIATVTVTVTAVNDTPLISGVAATSVNEDSSYTFTPTASDIENDTLTFFITNKPSWADFDSSTGQLSGTPTNSDVGTTDEIIISVNDGELSADLQAFNLSINNVNDAPVLDNTKDKEGNSTDINLDTVSEDAVAPE